MTLVYRAVWEDDWCEPVGVLEDEFKEWCASKGVDPDDVPRRGRFEPTDRLGLEVQRGDAEMGRVLRCRLHEVDNRGRTWTTTATALADDDVNTFWVDLECEDPEGRPAEMAAPRLVRGLIEKGGRPLSFGLPLRTEAQRLTAENVETLVDALFDEHRRAPIVVFSPDTRSGPAVTIERADAAAEAVAGVAHTFAVDPVGSRVLEAALPEGFRVYGGAAGSGR